MLTSKWYWRFKESWCLHCNIHAVYHGLFYQCFLCYEANQVLISSLGLLQSVYALICSMLNFSRASQRTYPMLNSFFGFRFNLRENMVGVLTTWKLGASDHWSLFWIEAPCPDPVPMDRFWLVLKLLLKFQVVTFIFWWVVAVAVRHTETFFLYVYLPLHLGLF